MKISVVIVLSGDCIDRYTNAMKQFEVLDRQTRKPDEIIYVEQSVDKIFYYDKLPIKVDGEYVRYIPIIYNKYPQLFNVCWCRNVGINNSIGDIVINLDVDYVFDNQYIESIANYDVKTHLIGWDTIYYIFNDQRVKFMRDNIFPVGIENIDGDKTIYKRYLKGNGGIQIFNKEWLLNNLGGYCEDLFFWGGDDTDIYRRAGRVDSGEKRLDYDVFHINHKKFYGERLLNKVVLDRNSVDIQKTNELLKSVGLGKMTEPSPIYPDTIKWALR